MMSSDPSSARSNHEGNEDAEKIFGPARATGGRHRRPRVIVADRRKPQAACTISAGLWFPSIRDDHRRKAGGSHARLRAFVSSWFPSYLDCLSEQKGASTVRPR